MTIDRTELYVVGPNAELRAVDTLVSVSGLPMEELRSVVYRLADEAAALHLFRVAAGLDSMVVGESQILGQLRDAYGTAAEHGAAGRLLHELMQQALRVGKRVHAETGLDQVGRSVVSEALADATAALCGLTGRRALIVGAGSMGGLSAAALRRAGIESVIIANRTQENGARLAESLCEQGVPGRP